MEQDREHISKDMEAEDFLREGLELQGVRMTAIAPLLLKFRRAEAGRVGSDHTPRLEKMKKIGLQPWPLCFLSSEGQRQKGWNVTIHLCWKTCKGLGYKGKAPGFGDHDQLYPLSLSLSLFLCLFLCLSPCTHPRREGEWAWSPPYLPSRSGMRVAITTILE